VARLEGRRVLITGASGFIGSHVTRAVVAEGGETYALVEKMSEPVPTRLADVAERVHFLAADLTDPGALRSAVGDADADFVLHLAAFTHVGRSFSHVADCVETNVAGTVNLLQALQGTRYRRFVYTSTSEVYGSVDVPFREDGPVNPVSPYSVTKYAAELMCRMFHRAHGWPIVVLRPFNCYGPGQDPDRIIPEVIVSAIRGVDVPMTEGTQTREFNFVEDIAEGFLLAAVAGEEVDGQIINLACGEEHSMREVATTILEMMGHPAKALFGAIPYRPTEIWRMYGDNTRARELLAWKPTRSLRDGLEQTIAWYQERRRD
jgi:nucleoside-diphosphate-sugar epimerase